MPDIDIDVGLVFENDLPGMSILQLREELTEYLGAQADVVSSIQHRHPENAGTQEGGLSTTQFSNGLDS